MCFKLLREGKNQMVTICVLNNADQCDTKHDLLILKNQCKTHLYIFGGAAKGGVRRGGSRGRPITPKIYM